MTTSQKNFTLCKPTGGDPISLGDLAYMQARNRYNVYELVLKEFQRSDLSQADLARRLGKKPEIVCRWLGAPGNWTLDTVSDLLFAISGAEVEYSLAYPCDMPRKNHSAPHWLSEQVEPVQTGRAPTSGFGTKATPQIRWNVAEPA